MDYSVPRFPATAAAKSLQSCPTLCDHIDGSPTRLPSPCDSPGKNTEVGCHFHLQCMKVKSESEVDQSCRTLSDPMDCSLSGSSVHGISQARVLECGAVVFSPGFPVHPQLLKLAQTHVYRVGNAIQPSHPLSSPSPPTFNLSQHQGLFQWVSSSHQVAKVLEFQLQHQSFQWILRSDFF